MSINKYRSHYLGDLRKEDSQSTVTVSGWVKKKRNLGELIFVDVRDGRGFAQVIFTKDQAEAYEIANTLRNEDVVTISGLVQVRKDINAEIPTGEIEIIATSLTVINKSAVTPMIIDDETDALEDTRLDYRYLDLRRAPIQDMLKLRHKVTMAVRNYLDGQGFLEIETPMLTKATPEGARDYLVPSRVNKNQFYALPQSPQIYKNLLMLGGIDRYFQIVKCFRDEDLRADRQPEFTQIDMELAFVEEEQVMEIQEQMFKQIFAEVMNLEIEDKFERMTYDDAMNNYGLDKPDLRFDLKLNDVTEIFASSEFKVFQSAEVIKTIVMPNMADKYSRKDLERLEAVCKNHHAKGMAWLKMSEEGLTGPIAKFLSSTEQENLIEKLNLTANDLLVFGADTWNVVCSALGNLRNYIAKEQNLIAEGEFRFVWITDWPLFEYDEEAGRYIAMHHPFTMPQNNKFADNVLETKARAYDLVLNGYEIGGGSIRINDREIQDQMFKHVGLSEAEVEEQFGFYLKAYSFGAPAHAGIAFGLDRLVMILGNTENIRDVIAFPKNAKAREPMMESPAFATAAQLAELNITLCEENK
ncbi:aspartate--tRNA ligase [Mollicutes bacterium LVI A0039]|nr:aspartate--tRNA ligase [Mollicutes bacterium LVI A0039]